MGQDEAFLLDGQSQREKKKKSNDGLINLTWRPFDWFRKLSDVLHWSFVLSVVIVYGINQGLSLGLSRISIQYYMKDEQKLQPSEAQIFTGIISLPWIVKPLWGLLTDILPIAGFRRKPYLIIAGSLGVIAMLTLSMNQLRIELALLCLMAGSAGVAIADVIIDACVTENSISHPSLAGDMQSLCGGSSSVGQLIGYMISGFLVHLIGSKGVFGILSMPPSLVVLVGIMMREKKFMPSGTYRRVSQKFADAGKAMVMALKCKTIWRPCLYMYISLALSLHIHEGMFYWYTDAKDGPSFSQEVVGSISSVGAVGSLLGVLLYHNAFRHHPFRRVLFWSQLLFGASGLLDLILVSRINLKFGIPDYFVAVSDAAVTHMIARLKWMPLLVLSSKLCPSGIEGTFFALLMSIDHAGMLSASWAGGFLLHIFNVTRTQFDNLWIVIVVRSFLRVLPIGLLFLVPSSDPTASILPIEMLPTKKGESSGKTDDTEMATTLIKTVDQTLAEE